MIYSLYKTSLFRKDIYGIILCFFITLLQYVCFYALLREHSCLHFISLFGIIFLCFFVKIPNTSNPGKSNSPICILLFRDIFIEIPLLQLGQHLTILPRTAI